MISRFDRVKNDRIREAIKFETDITYGNNSCVDMDMFEERRKDFQTIGKMEVFLVCQV